MTALSTAMGAWNRYWFEPRSLLDLAMLRIVVTGTHVVWLVTFQYDRLLEQGGTDPALYDPLPLLKLMTLSLFGEPQVLSFGTWELIFWTAVVSGAAACLGLLTTAALVVCAISSNAFHLYLNAFNELHHPEAVMSIALTMLALAPCGRLLSADRVLFKRHAKLDATSTSAFAGWPLKLLMWLFALFYLSAFHTKLTRDGLEWFNGFTLQYYLAVDGLRWDRPVAVWLSNFHGLALAAQAFVITFQATFWLAIIFPRLRWIYVPAGLLLHIGFWWILNAPFPQWIACYVAFIPWTAALEYLRSGNEESLETQALT